jgi:rhodanese-related sulfurtransferase
MSLRALSKLLKTSSAVFESARRLFGTISVDSLLAKQQASSSGGGGDEDSLVLVDVRDPSEFSVSHIAGAVNVPVYSPDEKITELVENLAPDSDVVCYCLIGGRAAKLAEKLEALIGKQRGAPKPSVYLLDGSISAWALSGKPMVDGAGKATTDVDLERAPPALKQLFLLS